MTRHIFTRILGPAMSSPAFRSYWLGTLASVAGFQVLNFTQFWVIHELTQSPLYLGYVGLASALPAIGLNIFGGVLADRLDRKKLIAITQLINGTLVLILALLTVTKSLEAWQVIVIAFLAGGVNAFDQPARSALFPSLIDRKFMTNAVALTAVIWTGTRIIAPAAAGMIISFAGTSTAFFLSSIGFYVMASVVISLDVPTRSMSNTSGKGDLLEGIKFVAKNNMFLFLISMSFFNSFFGMSYIPMMPVFAKDILYVGADAQGYLMGVGGIGALTVTMIIARSNLANHRKVLIVAGAFLFGLMITLFSITSKQFGSYPIALILMFFIGASGSTYMISIMNSLQIMVPDHMRGRVMGFYGMTWNIMPLGAIYSGSLAGMFGEGGNGVPIAVALGGILVALFAIGPAALNKNLRLATDINRSG